MIQLMWLHETLKTIIKGLFEKEENRLNKQISNLIRENGLLGFSSDGFFFNSIYYTDLESVNRSKITKLLH